MLHSERSAARRAEDEAGGEHAQPLAAELVAMLIGAGENASSPALDQLRHNRGIGLQDRSSSTALAIRAGRIA
jgi:hypothetical protein